MRSTVIVINNIVRPLDWNPSVSIHFFSLYSFDAPNRTAQPFNMSILWSYWVHGDETIHISDKLITLFGKKKKIVNLWPKFFKKNVEL